MTEQETREKIVEVLKKSREEWEIITPSIGILDEPRVDIEIDNLADTLIAAGIGDVKKEKFEADHYWNMWQGALVELERAERRAARAEKALQIADELGELCGRKEDYVQQAEKQLAEEEK